MQSLLYFAQDAYTDLSTGYGVDPSVSASNATAQANIAAGTLMTVLIIVGIAVLLVSIPMIINMWVLFQKAGRPGWKAIIPFYNYYVMGEIADNTKMAVIYIVTAIVVPPISIVFYIMLLISFIKKYSGPIAFWVMFFLFPVGALFLVRKMEYIDGTSGVASPYAGSPMAFGSQPVAPVFQGPAQAQAVPPTQPQASFGQQGVSDDYPSPQQPVSNIAPGQPVAPNAYGPAQPAPQGVQPQQPQYGATPAPQPVMQDVQPTSGQTQPPQPPTPVS